MADSNESAICFSKVAFDNTTAYIRKSKVLKIPICSLIFPYINPQH